MFAVPRGCLQAGKNTVNSAQNLPILTIKSVFLVIGGEIMSQSNQDLLQKIPVFSHLDSGSLDEIVPFFKEKTYGRGDILFQEDSVGDRLYIIIEGEIEIIKKVEETAEKTTLALRKNGDVIGEMSLFGEEPRFASARAAKQTRVLELSKLDFQRMLYEHPQVAYQVMRVLSSRLKQSDLCMLDELKKKKEQLREACESLERAAKTLKDSNQG
jgi:CRP/FNR family cyclic AMP-dependent transcriptional regulator